VREQRAYKQSKFAKSAAADLWAHSTRRFPIERRSERLIYAELGAPSPQPSPKGRGSERLIYATPGRLLTFQESW
jgi:hypothetical protein